MFKRLFSGSHMTRECPVRFYEGLSGKFRGSTHHNRLITIFVFWVFNVAAQNILSLDEIALKFDTDKSSRINNFTALYDKYFSATRFSPIKFLEIGIFQGESVKMWDEYFTNKNSNLYFLDIDEKSLKIVKELVAANIISHRVNCSKIHQENIQELLNFTASVDNEFDVIVDDGGHTMDQQITSFITLFPFLKPGGIYVIEDLCTSYWKEYGGHGSRDNPSAGPGTAIQFLMDQIHNLNYIASKTGIGDVSKFSNFDFENYFQRHILSIHFYNCICFIFKY